MTTVTDQLTGKKLRYHFNFNGNATSVDGPVDTVQQTIAYTYGDNNWKDKLTAYNGTTISYDAIGNLTSDGMWTYTWTNGRQLASVSKSGTTASYTYNENGLWVQKNVNGTVTSYILYRENVVH